MKNVVKYTLAATLVAGAAAQPHYQHQHHHHAKKHAGSKVEKREPDGVVEYVVAATETVYELAGKLLSGDEVKAGIENGDLVIVGESQPTYIPPPPETSAAPSSSEAEIGAQFIESKTSSTVEPEPTTTSSPPTTTSVAEPTTSSSSSSSTAAKATTTKSSSSGSSGTTKYDAVNDNVNKVFPSDVPCGDVPTEYGAVYLDWLDMGGWSGLQYLPDYSPSVLSFSDIVTGIAGDNCSPGYVCSYACPPGYQKTQWPKGQGSEKESIGGIYCNKDGILELTRPEYDTLCEPGEGGVFIQNDLDEDVASCRTDYPGTEAMVVPTFALAGSEIELCNPNQDTYYQWGGAATSAQYYTNKKGYGLSDSCVWDSILDPKGAGNWSPCVIGTGFASDDVTYISLAQNPETTDKLDFNIEITGGNSECAYTVGEGFTGGGTGCTVSFLTFQNGPCCDYANVDVDWPGQGQEGYHPILLDGHGDDDGGVYAC